MRTTQPWSAMDDLVSFELFSSQSGPEDPWDLTFELVCRWTYFPSGKIGIKRGFAEIDLGQAITKSAKDRLGGQGAYTTEQGNVTLTAAGPTQRPNWIIESNDGPIGIVTLPHDICPVEDLANGDTIKATFSVWFKDLEPIPEDERDEEESDQQEDSISFTREDGKPLGRNKKALLNLIDNLEKTDGQTGRVIVATHELHFKGETDE